MKPNVIAEMDLDDPTVGLEQLEPKPDREPTHRSEEEIDESEAASEEESREPEALACLRSSLLARGLALRELTREELRGSRVENSDDESSPSARRSERRRRMISSAARVDPQTRPSRHLGPRLPPVRVPRDDAFVTSDPSAAEDPIPSITSDVNFTGRRLRWSDVDDDDDDTNLVMSPRSDDDDDGDIAGGVGDWSLGVNYVSANPAVMARLGENLVSSDPPTMPRLRRRRHVDRVEPPPTAEEPANRTDELELGARFRRLGSCLIQGAQWYCQIAVCLAAVQLGACWDLFSFLFLLCSLLAVLRVPLPWWEDLWELPWPDRWQYLLDADRSVTRSVSSAFPLVFLVIGYPYGFIPHSGTLLHLWLDFPFTVLRFSLLPISLAIVAAMHVIRQSDDLLSSLVELIPLQYLTDSILDSVLSFYHQLLSIAPTNRTLVVLERALLAEAQRRHQRQVIPLHILRGTDGQVGERVSIQLWSSRPAARELEADLARWPRHVPPAASSDPCGICHEPIPNDHLVLRTTCGHETFHASCLGQWFQQRQRCPLCRAAARPPSLPPPPPPPLRHNRPVAVP